jgi:hypothetical protein
MKNSDDTIGNPTRNLPACSPVPQPTAPPPSLRDCLVLKMVGYALTEHICISVLRNADNHQLHDTVLPSKFPSHEDATPHTVVYESMNTVQINFGWLGIIHKETVENHFTVNRY